MWVSIAAIATLLSIFHGALGVPAKIKEEEQRRQQFSALRVDLETFRHSLTLGCELKEAAKSFDRLRERLSSCVSKTPPDIAFTKGARKRVQNKVNEKLKKYMLRSCAAMPLEPDDAQHLRAAEGYLALGMPLEANAELEEIDPDVRHVPEVLVVRMEVYRAAQKWDAMQTIARGLAKYDPNDVQWTVS